MKTHIPSTINPDKTECGRNLSGLMTTHDVLRSDCTHCIRLFRTRMKATKVHDSFQKQMDSLFDPKCPAAEHDDTNAECICSRNPLRGI